MDIKAKVEELVVKLKSDKTLADKFKSDPVGTAKSLVGVDIPDDRVKAVADAVLAKLNLDKPGGPGGLFGKK